MFTNGVYCDEGAAKRFSLATSRDELSTSYFDPQTGAAITEILARSHKLPVCNSPLQDLQELLDAIRSQPPGPNRTTQMNAFVRTLGQPENLAILLDQLRDSLCAPDTREAEISHRSRRGRMHCIYGWAGQTLLLASHPEPTSGTVHPTDDMNEFLGYPPAEWDLSIHIWQPNPEAEGFASTKRIEPGLIAEPPHSHPFDFVSYVVVGEMRQSIYAESTVMETSHVAQEHDVQQRYAGVVLERVDGVWPPHQEYQASGLHTLEESVLLRAGQSYFIPSHAIHDVEIDRTVAERTPAITLFMCAEATVKPKAFMVPEMAEYHRQHPELKEAVEALSPDQWRSKLTAVVAYLRRQSSTLQLGEVVQCGSTYSFMNV